jgi:hypothetical protein
VEVLLPDRGEVVDDVPPELVAAGLDAVVDLVDVVGVGAELEAAGEVWDGVDSQA